MIDPLDFRSRLDELKLLKDGWLDGKGQAPPAEGLDWLALAFDEHYPRDLGLPYVYPVAEGGVRLEWSFGPDDLSLEIDTRERAGAWHALNLDNDTEEARTLRLDADAGWEWLVGRLRALTVART